MENFEKVYKGFCPKCGHKMRMVSGSVSMTPGGDIVPDWICDVCLRHYCFLGVGKGYYQSIPVIANTTDHEVFRRR